jgi:hypothetical protein
MHNPKKQISCHLKTFPKNPTIIHMVLSKIIGTDSIVPNLPLAVHIWRPLVGTLDDHSLEACHTIPLTCSPPTLLQFWRFHFDKWNIPEQSKRCFISLHEKKISSRKIFLKNFCMSKSNIIFHRTCYSPREFLMIELEIYWLLSSRLKWALEQVHPYLLFELQVTFITHDVFIVFQSSPMNMKNGIIKGERLFECNHLGRSLTNREESFWNAVYEHLMTLYGLGLSTIKWLHFIQNIVYILIYLHEGQ